MKKLYIVFFLFVSILILSGCDIKDEKREVSDDPIELTLEELSMYDGKNGSKAYIAVDGKIYDVTESSRWRDGEHNGFEAGQDLTEQIKNISPHGTDVLSGIPEIGTLIEDEPDMIYLTIDMLAMYDGSGEKAYIAYDGIIYDVTEVEAWSGGEHNGVMAGQDITKEVSNAPHGDGVVSGLNAIGELVIDVTGDGPYDPYMYLTISELSMYDGKDGNDAYIAVNGIIYDVSHSSKWSGGDHNGYDAGQDLTDEINSISPHGVSVLDNLVIVGEIRE